jgi:hypothetical protein
MKHRQQSLDRVISTMKLRAPQREALEKFHTVLSMSNFPLKEMTSQEISHLFSEAFPKWVFPHSSPEFTFHLATGVGKTRLIGAIIAYLYLSGDAKNFMIISPRTEIVRKFLTVCTPGDANYIFVDQALIEYPSLFNGEQSVTDYTQSRLFGGGPNIWVLSPQAFSANNARLKTTSESDVCSPVEYFSKLDDLVIFFDESHHLGLDDVDDSVWRSELNALDPRMIIGTTASVSENQNNIIYSYDLKTCLNEHKYTKFVRMIPDKKPEMLSDEEYDHVTLKFGLNLLSQKQGYLDNFCEINNVSKKVKAVMLVACESIEHAEAITKWLQGFLGSKDAVLLVHSKLNESEFVPKLKLIEDINSPIKVVVNVAMLNEGWDVSNIYVITPLRAMASTTLVTQIMGRGLRLPFGSQVNDDNIDTLDVLCFGRETLQEIINKLTIQGFGYGYNTGITVDPETNPAHPEDFVPKKKINLSVVGSDNLLNLPQFKMERARLPISDISIPALKPHELSSFFINDPKTVRRLGTDFGYEYNNFLDLVSSEVLKSCKFLKFRDFPSVKDMVIRFLEKSGFSEGIIKLDPSRVVAHIVKCLVDLNKMQLVHYIPLHESLTINLDDIQISVPETYEFPNDNTMSPSAWTNRQNKGIPFGGWRRCIYKAVPFDNKYEYHIAQIIDTAAEIKSWLRNLPGIITLPTPAGQYSPDFAIFIELEDKKVLLEIKDDDRFGREDQDATIKARAAQSWCHAQSEASGEPWEYWLLLVSDSELCETFNDIEEYSDSSID